MITAKITYPKGETQPDARRFVWGGTEFFWRSQALEDELNGIGEAAQRNAANAARRAERLEIEKLKKRFNAPTD